jgi:hypothetical protein
MVRWNLEILNDGRFIALSTDPRCFIGSAYISQ